MADLIDRQAALEKIHWLGLDNDTAIKCDLAIRALPSVTPSRPTEPCEDAINRQAALDVIAETDITNGTEPVFTGKQVQALLRDLPSVTPKQRTGHWIEQDGYDGDVYYDCSICGNSWTTIDGTPWQNGMNYCPNCGAKMESEVSE